MTKAPAFQFYAAEYLADMNVQLLTLEQEGAYIRLLSFCWREGKVPNNDLRLASLCKNCKVAILSAVKALFEVSEDGEFLTHKRLEKERVKHDAYRERQSQNGTRGGRPVKPKETQPFTKTEESEKGSQSSSFASSSSSSSAKQELKTLASTAVAVPAARSKLVCTLPLNDGTDHEVFEPDVLTWIPLYPAVDVRQELRSLKGWLLGNPKLRKTRTGIARFINSWLSRAQNDAKPGVENGNGKTSQPTNRTIERQQISHDAIRAALVRRLGPQTSGDDGPGAGFLPDASSTTGDAGCVVEGLGGDGSGDRTGEIREGSVAKHADGEFHP